MKNPADALKLCGRGVSMKGWLYNFHYVTVTHAKTQYKHTIACSVYAYFPHVTVLESLSLTKVKYTHSIWQHMLKWASWREILLMYSYKNRKLLTSKLCFLWKFRLNQSVILFCELIRITKTDFLILPQWCPGKQRVLGNGILFMVLTAWKKWIKKFRKSRKYPILCIQKGLSMFTGLQLLITFTIY